MATPVPDSYSVASGAVIYGGRSAAAALPLWLPTVGNRSSVSLNTISTVYPVNAPDSRTRGSPAILSAWCGTAYAEGLGALGSIIASGGGHADYLGNEVYRYDIATRVWSRISEPYDIPVSLAIGSQADDPTDGPGTGTGVSETTYGEYWADDTKSAGVVGQMCPTHTYGHILWVSGTAAGNTNGWLVIVGNFNVQCHKVDLDSPSLGWARFGPRLDSTGKSERPAYGCSLFDPSRNRVFCFPFGNGAQPYGYAMTVPVGALTTPSSGYMDSYYGVAHYDAADDLYVMMRADDPRVVQVYDPVTTLKHTPAVSGTVPAVASGTVGWIGPLRQLFFWPNIGSTVYFLQAPANPRTETWTWSARTFGGDAPALGNQNALYARLHYIPALHALMHVGTTTGPVQSWRL